MAIRSKSDFQNTYLTMRRLKRWYSGFSTGFELYSGVLPSGVTSPSLIKQYWLNDFNKNRRFIQHGTNNNDWN